VLIIDYRANVQYVEHQAKRDYAMSFTYCNLSYICWIQHRVYV